MIHFNACLLILGSSSNTQWMFENRFSTLGTLPDDAEECWQSLRTVIREAADRIVGL